MTNHEPLHFAERKMRSLNEYFPRVDEHIEYAERQAKLGFPDEQFLDERFSCKELLPYAKDLLVSMKTIADGAARRQNYQDDGESLCKELMNESFGLFPGTVTAYRRWRDCKHIYRFDATLNEELFNQPLDDNLPKALFDYLPYDICFIDCSSTANFEEGDWDIAGFWVFRSTSPSDDGSKMEDRLHMLCLTCGGYLNEESLTLDNPTISGIVNKVLDGCRDVLGKIDLPDSYCGQGFLDEEALTLRITKVLNLVLYVCSVNADITQAYQPSPSPKKENPKKRNRKSQAYIYDVGFRIGPALGAVRSQKTLPISGAGSAKAPHVRRAHWHHYWKGPMDGERKLILKWISPINVNMSLGAPSLTLHEAHKAS